MRKLWVSQLVAAAVWVGTAGAQTTVNGGRNMSGELRVSGVTATINTGSSLPGTCLAGPPQDVFVRTSDNTLHRCSAANTWTQVSVGSVDAAEGVQTASGNPVTASGTIRAAQLMSANTGTTYTVVTGDRGKELTFNNASAVAVTLPQAGSSFPNGWFAVAKNLGGGDVTVTPTVSTISGTSSVAISTGEWCVIASDGTNYEALCNRLTAGTGVVLSKSRTGTQASADTAVMLSRATDQAGAGRYCAPSGASGTAYTCGLTPALTAYTAGGLFVLKPDVNSGANPTLAIDGLASANLQKLSGGTLVNVGANDLSSSGAYLIIRLASSFLVVGI